MYANLPEMCYSFNETLGEAVIIKRGEDGYYPTSWGKSSQEVVALINERLGVTEAQRLAMEIGSMFGWEVPGANPAIYEKDRQVASVQELTSKTEGWEGDEELEEKADGPEIG